MTRHDTRAAAAARRARAARPPAAAALPAQGRAGGPRDRPRAALGPGRSRSRAARRGSRRPRPGHDQDAPPRVRAAGRQDLRRLGRGRLRRSRPPPSRRSGRWNGSAAPRTSASAGPAAPASRTWSKRSGTSRSTRARPSPGTPWNPHRAVRRHRADDTVSKAIGRLIRADLIVIDDIGMLPVSPDAAEALFRVVDAAYERRSLAITSNMHPSGFDELMPKTLAAATVDRLLHHAHVLVCDRQRVLPPRPSHRRPGRHPPHHDALKRVQIACSLAYGSLPARPELAGAGEFRWPPAGR